MSWKEQAKCAGYDTEMWFSNEQADQQQAVAICGRCPVQIQCAAYARVNRERYGIWGGLVGGRREVQFARHLPSGVRHGTASAYNRHGCRCEPCRAYKAQLDSRRRRYRRAS
jgi:hypothetical protein